MHLQDVTELDPVATDHFPRRLVDGSKILRIAHPGTGEQDDLTA